MLEIIGIGSIAASIMVQIGLKNILITAALFIIGAAFILLGM